ncbi:MAG: hypothetical protein HPAVJP_3000 [Candidatus Hepatoplasma vulgare]|nr:MAG: hypothetical protein HPAVJP_3000 [Candidatus Hepatoplasma sp.]
MKIIVKQTKNESKLKSNNICNKKDLMMGKYHSPSLEVINSEKIRPNLIKINSLNENFVKEQINPNKFNALKCGKFTFKFYVKSILSDISKKTLEFNLYLNNRLKKTIEYPIEKRINNNVLLLTDLEVKKGDIIYFDCSIKEKKGRLILNSINYEIKFSLENVLNKKIESSINAEEDIYSSLITDDSGKNPDYGINPWKGNIDLIISSVNELAFGEIPFTGINLNGETITEWPSEGVSLTSELTDDSKTNINSGINPWKRSIDILRNDFVSLQTAKTNFLAINLNGETITKWSDISSEGVSLTSELTDNSVTNPTQGINPWKTQIDSNKNEILELKNQLEDLKSPIGSIIISVLPPNYGVWSVLGTLEDGQTIIGGNSSDGSIISHNHQWSAGVTTFTAGLVIGIGNSINKFNTYDQTGNSKSIGSNVLIDNNDKTQTGWTSLTGSENKNKAYGLGIGTGMRIFRREK